MRDDTGRWDAPRADQPLDADGVSLRPARIVRQVLVSGRHALRRTALPLVEWPNVAAPRDGLALCLRRDRVLEVDGPARTDGWDGEAGLAVSDVTDGLAVFDLGGPRAFDILRRGTEIGLDRPSRSVARVLFGLDVLIYRTDEDVFRLHVPRAAAEALRGFVDAAARGASDGGPRSA